MIWSEDNFQYAIENTEVILAPQRKIATFGSTSFRFYLISELMDKVDVVRVRDGRIHAERPQILTPDHFSRLLLEGFGDKAERYVEKLRAHAEKFAVMRYGFQFRKTDVTEKTVRDSIASVTEPFVVIMSLGRTTEPDPDNAPQAPEIPRERRALPRTA